MKYLIRLIIFCVLFPIACWGQDVKMQMTQIKKDLSYLKAEANGTDAESALKIASLELLVQINDLLQAKGDSVLYTEDKLQPIMQSLSLQRGEDRFRVLAYVKRSVVLGEPEQEQEVADSINEPPLDAIDEPVVINLFPVETQVQAVEEVTTDVQVQIPVETQAETSVETQAEIPVETPVTVVSVATETESTPVADMSVVVESLTQMETSRDILDALKQFKESGQIKDYGGIRTAQDNLSDKYIIVFSKQKHTLRALLSPERQGKRTDLLTNEDTELSNFKGEVAVLFE